MDNDAPYIEHIESEEIKKLVNLIYTSKPEDMMTPPESNHEDIHHEIADQIDRLSPPRKPE